MCFFRDQTVPEVGPLLEYWNEVWYLQDRKYHTGGSLNNQEISLLIAANRVLEQFSLTPADVLVDLQAGIHGEFSLVLTPARHDRSIADAFRRMVTAFGFGDDQFRLEGKYGDIHAEIVRVLQLLPETRPFDAVDNVNTALMSKVVELAGRYGVHPCSFVAGIRPEGKGSRIQFDMAPEDGPANKRFVQMLAALGIDADAKDQAVAGSEQQLYETLQEAIDLAPRSRPR